MALTKQQKTSVVDEISRLLSGSKMTVVANYRGTSVKSMQGLRVQGRGSNSVVRVAKNRLVKLAMSNLDKYSSANVEALQGQLLYAFCDSDETAAAKLLAGFAKVEPQITFVGAYDSDGNFIPPEQVQALAQLPSKEQLQSITASTLAAPLSGLLNVTAGNLRAVINVLNARTESKAS